jgi:hypothetical protein
VDGLRRAAPQKMETRFRHPVDPAGLSAVPGVTVTAIDGPRVTLDVTGDIGPVLRVIASHDPAGMALYTLAVVALYPSFKDSTSLDSLSGSTAAALLGVTRQLTSPGGWLNGNMRTAAWTMSSREIVPQGTRAAGSRACPAM